ncbi:MAG: M43 family zinc metalloprotease [Bacteroidota bacterium]|nr:M43 family zinc metalloprotease [Bacteroidota bacterium]
MRIPCLLALLLLFFADQSPAQLPERCGTMTYHQEQLLADPSRVARMAEMEQHAMTWSDYNSLARMQGVLTIPVVFHVIHNNISENIPLIRILSQLDVLNKDFSRQNADAIFTPAAFAGAAANTNIRFCLAKRDPNGNATTGIVRKSTPVAGFTTNDSMKFDASGGSDAWPSDSYLNIWICNLTGNVLGFAQFPGGNPATDGVVIKYTTVGGPVFPGTGTPYNLGRSATHEIGHWLNLLHVWGDAICGNDQVSDTPVQQTGNYGCPSFPHISCINGPNGDMFMNYMDYTDDACMNMFTYGQAIRMNAVLNGSRLPLLSSLGCLPPGAIACVLPTGLNATDITSSTATLSWDSVPGAASYRIRYKPVPFTGWSTTTSFTTSTTLNGLLNNVSYVYNVMAVCDYSNSNYSDDGTFTTLGCTDTIHMNNSQATARSIITNADINSLVAAPGEEDWYAFSTYSPEKNFQLRLSNLPGDYDMKLYDAGLKLISTSQNSGTFQETINHNSETAANYFIKIYGYNNASDGSRCYNFRVLTSEMNYQPGANMSNAAKKDLLDGIVTLPNPAGTETIFEFLSGVSGIATVSVVDVLGQRVYEEAAKIEEGKNRLRINVNNFSNGFYLVRINHPEQDRKGTFLIQH